MKPLAITQVITEDVGVPSTDGARGSGLYAVPIGLNREPDALECQLLVTHWNHPPSFTTMHRAGILRVVADRVILDGTTIDEVERHHASTLTLVVEKTNLEADEVRSRQAVEAAQRAERTGQHKNHVSEVADRIVF